MSLIAKKSGGADFETVPEGRYIARCYRVIDLGTQDVTFQGHVKQQPKIMLSWELLEDAESGKDAARMESSGEPFTIHKRYTLSLHEKSKLRPDLEAWRGKKFTAEEEDEFDLKKLVGTYCEIQVVHNEGKDGNTYANVNAIMSTKKKPKPHNEDLYFDLTNVDREVYEKLSDRLQDTIAASPEWVGMQKVADKEGTEVGGKPAEKKEEPKAEAKPTEKKEEAKKEPEIEDVDDNEEEEDDDIPF